MEAWLSELQHIDGEVAGIRAANASVLQASQLQAHQQLFEGDLSD